MRFRSRLARQVAAPSVTCHPESWVPVEHMGVVRPYRPTFESSRPYIDRFHAYLALQVPHQAGNAIALKTRRWRGRVIPGWLAREDAAKLYELAYYTRHDILELGAYNGLSTTILARGVTASLVPRRIVSVDMDPSCCRSAAATLADQKLTRLASVVRAEGHTALGMLAAGGFRFGLAFVDHAHTYDAVVAVCRDIHTVMADESFVLFHDFNDYRNGLDDDSSYGVHAAVVDGLPEMWQFCGVYGACALYRRSRSEISSA